jgi:hypothetical protein
MQSLEDLLNSNGPAPQANPEPQAAVIEQPAPPEPETEDPVQAATPDPVTGDDQGEQPTDQAAPPAASQDEPLDKKISAFQRKAEDETRKRQDYEKQLAEVRRQNEEQARYIQQVRQHFAQQQQQQGNGQDDEVDLYEPQQLQQYVGNILQRERSTMTEQMVTDKIVASQEIIKSLPQYEGYDEMETVFADEMKRREAAGDHSLRQRLNSHPFPAKFAFEEGKRLKLQQEMADPDAYRAKLEAELREKILAEQQQPASQAPTQAKPVPQPPKSLAGVPSASRDPLKHPWKGPTPLEQLLT